MTSLRLLRLPARAPKTREKEMGDRVEAFGSLLREVGQVKAGSLEEEIWRELGVLPRSRPNEK